MNKIARRQFLKGTAIAGAGFALPLKFLVERAYPFAQSPTLIRKFVTTLPGLGPSGANEIKQYIPLATKSTGTFAGLATDLYSLGVTNFDQQMHPDLGGKTKFFGYYDLKTGDKKYLGGVIVATRGTPVLLTITNKLPKKHILPVDPTIMVDPSGLTVGDLPNNRIATHLHGGLTPWFSDGTPFQWFTPDGQTGVSFMNVPGTHPKRGTATYYYPNDQSARLVWYHDHAIGLTRLNAYAGIASAYIITDAFETFLLNNGLLPDLVGIPLIIQDKTFVPKKIRDIDPTWKLGSEGTLWYPHVYESNSGPFPACPVNINTGDFIKHLRAESVKDESSALWLADHFAIAEKSIGLGVTLGHVAEKVIGEGGINSVLRTAEKISNTTLPKWNNSIPHRTKNLGALSDLRGEKEFIYFPSCISRQLGQPKSDSHLEGDCHLGLAETFTIIASRANINLSTPENVTGHCCGMPFQSKGYQQAYQHALHNTLMQMWDWSNHGQYPIVIDTTSCTHTLRTCKDDLSENDKNIYNKLTILDGVEFLHDHVLPNLNIHPVDEDVILHPNCSLRKLGLDNKMFAIAKQCAKSATVPLNLGCCAFAGDRGLLFPELTKSATEKETAEINSRDYDGYYSSNITCEIGMSEATGRDYVSIVYLVEKASR
jgi:Fe-S oxidoreductase